MNLSDVKYSNCEKCGRGFPLAHWVAPLVDKSITNNEEEDKFEKHSNKMCKPCMDDLKHEK